MKKKKNGETIAVYLPSEQVNELRELAELNQRSISYLVTLAVGKLLEEVNYNGEN